MRSGAPLADEIKSQLLGSSSLNPLRATSVQNQYDFRCFSRLEAGKGNGINGT
jgi:hypothetical protein